ncbi:MAG: hypothetical protein COA91_11140 [Robiginitomaculum sp.]|nr:MAG: hypothetical protein COA91_11140 [Robiginitomaculum sp.]
MTNQTQPGPHGINNFGTRQLLIAVLFIHTVAPLTFILQPIVVQGLVEQVGFSPKQANYIVFAEAMGKAVASILLIFAISFISWRKALVAALCVLVIGNIISMQVETYQAFMGVRIFTGAAVGIVVPLSYASIALTPQKDRNFGVLLAVLLVFASLIMLIAPTLYSVAGYNGLLAVLAGLAFFAIPFALKVPNGRSNQKNAQDQTADPHLLPWRYRIPALLGMFTFFTAMFAYWANAALIGRGMGLDGQQIANALSLSKIAGVFGAVTAAILVAKYGRALPLGISILLAAASVVFIYLGNGLFVFTAGIFIFHYLWNVAHPYLLSIMASFDNSGRTVVYATSMQMLGVAAGPFLVGTFVSDPSQGGGVTIITTVLAVSTFALLIPVTVYHERKKRHLSAVME